MVPRTNISEPGNPSLNWGNLAATQQATQTSFMDGSAVC